MPSDNLSDDEVRGRIDACIKHLGAEPAETIRGGTALRLARRVLMAVRIGLVGAAIREEDHLEGVKETEPEPPR